MSGVIIAVIIVIVIVFIIGIGIVIWIFAGSGDSANSANVGQTTGNLTPTTGSSYNPMTQTYQPPTPNVVQPQTGGASTGTATATTTGATTGGSSTSAPTGTPTVSSTAKSFGFTKAKWWDPKYINGVPPTPGADWTQYNKVWMEPGVVAKCPPGTLLMYDSSALAETGYGKEATGEYPYCHIMNGAPPGTYGHLPVVSGSCKKGNLTTLFECV